MVREAQGPGCRPHSQGKPLQFDTLTQETMRGRQTSPRPTQTAAACVTCCMGLVRGNRAQEAPTLAVWLCNACCPLSRALSALKPTAPNYPEPPVSPPSFCQPLPSALAEQQ